MAVPGSDQLVTDDADIDDVSVVVVGTEEVDALLQGELLRVVEQQLPVQTARQVVRRHVLEERGEPQIGIGKDGGGKRRKCFKKKRKKERNR